MISELFDAPRRPAAARLVMDKQQIAVLPAAPYFSSSAPLVPDGLTAGSLGVLRLATAGLASGPSGLLETHLRVVGQLCLQFAAGVVWLA